MSILHTAGSTSRDRAVVGPTPGAPRHRESASLRRLVAGEQRKRAARLTDALQGNGFILRYLPRIDLLPEGDLMSSAELWLGLPNRRRGVVAVAPILRDLDRKTLRHEVLEFMLRAAAAELAAWPAAWRIAVPVPGEALADGMVCQLVGNVMRAAGLDSGRIDLLIDETELVEGGIALHQEVVILHEQGIGVALEGFGAIFGSLALLHRLPLTGLKFDRRFAHASVDAGYAPEITLVRAAVEIARRAGIRVTIDGVETELELDHVRRLGVDQAQGPWVGPALPGETMRARACRGG